MGLFLCVCVGSFSPGRLDTSGDEFCLFMWNTKSKHRSIVLASASESGKFELQRLREVNLAK